MKFYQFEAPLLAGGSQSMDVYRDKTVLVVNTASKCGLTPQYQGLEQLYRSFKDQGLVILGFPCNQFGNQEPGSSEQIATFCAVNYGVSFPMFARVDVNGDNAHPLFAYLKKELPGTLGIGTIKWNFTKFLITKDGKPAQRFSPVTTPDRIGDYLKKVSL